MTTPPFRLRGLDHVVLRVRDVETMLTFYRTVLGCTVVKHQEGLGLYHLDAGTALIDFVTLDGQLGRAGGVGPAAEGRNVDHFAIKISPFDESAIQAHFASHGIKAGAVETRFGAEGSGPSIYITDPEGNGVELKGI